MINDRPDPGWGVREVERWQAEGRGAGGGVEELISRN